MAAKRISVGFDLRMDPGLQSVRQDQCLVPGVSPIGADPSVWSGTEAVEHLMAESPTDFSNPLHLACSLEVLVETCQKRGIPTVGLLPVCITCAEASVMVLAERFGSRWFKNQPTEEYLLSRGWRLEGFDVVDIDGLISGLKGCGYPGLSREILQQRFGSCLLRTGLFEDSATASEFAEVRGLQIRGHAPFVVVGVLIHKQL